MSEPLKYALAIGESFDAVDGFLRFEQHWRAWGDGWRSRTDEHVHYADNPRKLLGLRDGAVIYFCSCWFRHPHAPELAATARAIEAAGRCTIEVLSGVAP